MIEVVGGKGSILVGVDTLDKHSLLRVLRVKRNSKGLSLFSSQTEAFLAFKTNHKIRKKETVQTNIDI